jgi:hypothetical protein
MDAKGEDLRRKDKKVKMEMTVMKSLPVFARTKFK